MYGEPDEEREGREKVKAAAGKVCVREGVARKRDKKRKKGCKNRKVG